MPSLGMMLSITEALKTTPSQIFQEHPEEDNRGDLLLTAAKMIRENIDLMTIQRVLPSLTMSELRAVKIINSFDAYKSHP